MSVGSVPRETRPERLSVRVPATVKDQVRDSVDALKSRGVRTTASELVEMLVAEGLHASPAQLDVRLRDWRKRNQEAAL
jgi:Tfp pilus assembly PilM family ATPase